MILSQAKVSFVLSNFLSKQKVESGISVTKTSKVGMLKKRGGGGRICLGGSFNLSGASINS
jgi:hypothetical protein